MTMETFRKLLVAAGFTVDDQSLDQQCKMTAFAKNVNMIQPILKKADGIDISLSAHLIAAGATCKLVKISLDGC
jgi:hypothetical protein